MEQDINNVSKDNLGTKTGHSHRKIMVMVVIITLLVSAFFGTIFGFMAGNIGQKIAGSRFSSMFNLGNSQESPNVIKQKIIQEDSAVIDVVDKTSPAVVSIVMSKDVPTLRDFFFNPFGNQGGSGTQKQQIGGGSGFIITVDGMIATNRHVVEDTTAQYTVITSDNKEHDAKILARDPINDIAVIKIDGNNYPTLNFGDSGSLKIGQTVIAIGNSLGEFSNTVSRGIISGLKRSVTVGSGLGDTERLSNIIQTDAAINPGNSGGPLLDIDGNVIGINVAMAQGAQNIGFAIPSNQIKKVIDQVKTTGKISASYLGVRYLQIDDTLQKQNNLPYNYGVLVTRGQTMADLAVIPGSPADKAGIAENDIILEANGTKFDDNNTLSDVISQHNIGDQLALKVWRKGSTMDVNVTLEERTQ